MLSKVHSGTTIGLEGVLIDVEVDVASRGFPTFTVVGLPDKAVAEAKDRVRAAVTNASYEMPDSKITVNLAPADIPKVGSSFDLPIAIGIMAASGIIDHEMLSKSVFLGELSLEGNVRRVPGVISIASMAREKGMRNVFVPAENCHEAILIDGVSVYPISRLTDLVLHLNKTLCILPQREDGRTPQESSREHMVDFSEVRGQEHAKRALEIAAAGFHNIHLKGPPGTGKTLLSRAFPSILPPMTRGEILEVTKIYSVVGMLGGRSFILERPFRAPHHTTSRIGLIGGGSKPGPGEISLAHRGVLFLDEFPEFPRSVLESLRQPVEDGVITISRAAGSLTFPARFILVAASNPCPCGYFGHPKKRCRCPVQSIEKYRKRISGPLADRIDLHVDVPMIDQEKLMRYRKSEGSDLIRSRVIAARKRQEERLKLLGIATNGEMTSATIKEVCRFESGANDLLRQAISKLSLSARSYFKILKISQTIADLAGEETITSTHVAEALQYRKDGE